MSTTSRYEVTAPPGLAGVLSKVSGERMAATVAALAAEEYAGRRVGSAGGAAARGWLQHQLAELGATFDVDPFPVPAVPEVYAAPHAQWSDGERMVPLAFGRQVAVPVASADLPAPRRGSLGVAGADPPAGRWLLVPAGMSLPDAYRHAGAAAGLLQARGVDGDGWQYTMLAGPTPGRLPVLALDPGTYAAMRHAAGSEADAWFAGSAPIRRVDVTAGNLYARWPAPADRSAMPVLLTAHYDGVGDLPGLRQPAAADNASGVAVLLEAARVLAAAPPARLALSVALLDGEEVGALGSARHAARLRSHAARPRNPAPRPWVINVDGAGQLHGAVAVEAGGPAEPLLSGLDQAGRHAGVPLAAGPVASDNRRYAAAGLPAVGLGAGMAAVGLGAGMAAYHSPADLPERVEPAAMVAVARLVVASVWLAATDRGTISIVNRR
ncbi:MAG TPA: M28 family peptidase [Natronosporangium sp.]